MTTFTHLAKLSSPTTKLTDSVRRRLDGRPTWVTLIELFIGAGWIRAATEKLISPGWWSGDELAAFAAEQEQHALGWYAPFLEFVVAPLSLPISWLVVFSQLAIGMVLFRGERVGWALASGIGLNLHFIAAGEVTPSVFYVLAQASVLLWLAERASPTEAQTPSTLRAVAVFGFVVAAASLPWVRTIHPDAVIDDPAVILVTVGALGMLLCDACHRRLLGDGLLDAS